MYKKREKDLDTSPQIKSLQPNNKTRLRELKDKILGIDLCINDTHEKLKSFKQGIITISNPYRQDHKHFFSSTSSSLSSTMIIPITSSLPSSSPTSCLLSNQLYTDPLARPIIDTSMRIIDEREKAMKIAYEAYEEIMRKVEKIKIDQQNYLKLVIDQYVQDSEIEKAKAREEYERILKLIDHDLMNKIEQARIQCQQKLEEKIKALYEDIQSVCIETEIDTLNIKKAIQEKINSESSFHNNFNSHTKSYFPNQASSTNNNNNKFILESSISTMTKHDSLIAPNTSPNDLHTHDNKSIYAKLDEIKASLQGLESMYKPNGDNTQHRPNSESLYKPNNEDRYRSNGDKGQYRPDGESRYRSNGDEDRYKPNGMSRYRLDGEDQHKSNGDERQYRSGGESRYKPSDEDLYSPNGDKGRYRPDGKDQYRPNGDEGQDRPNDEGQYRSNDDAQVKPMSILKSRSARGREEARGLVGGSDIAKEELELLSMDKRYDTVSMLNSQSQYLKPSYMQRKGVYKGM